jgi:prepilin-type N-terminal cleavage/methylation domain-containing protein
MSLEFKKHRKAGGGGRAFTIIELLLVIAIIAILVGISFPEIRSMTKSSNLSQASNLVRAMLETARATAISQHRVAGVVFFEETAQYAYPVHAGQTAMQLCVESFDQTGLGTLQLGMVSFNPDRQYLPQGVILATLSNPASNPSGVATGQVIGVQNADARTAGGYSRVILFDANGQLLLRAGLSLTPTTIPPYPCGGSNPPLPVPGPNPPAAGTPGTYPQAYGDWGFIGSTVMINGNAVLITTSVTPVPFSSPGFILYNKSDYEAAESKFGVPPSSNSPDQDQAIWLKKNATVVSINVYTGSAIR